eukprot:TRINITY_DN4134_c0_g2_i1.p1 TRINITY_DN4134_c0_g2~~TRINITY_DN4134_c0_g2_i1.p1  ORF type:complete len:154 (-),score=22.50 TRINITY_DN4134_c0_g2_i1:306-767(-)
MENIKKEEKDKSVTLTKEHREEIQNLGSFETWVPFTGKSDYSRIERKEDIKNSETEEFFKSLSRRPYVQKNLGRDGHIPTIEVELGLFIHRGTHSEPLFESATFTAIFDTGAEISVITEEMVSPNCLNACYMNGNIRWIYVESLEYFYLLNKS